MNLANVFGRKPAPPKTTDELIQQRITSDGDLQLRIHAMNEHEARQERERARGRGLPPDELDERIAELDETVGAEVAALRSDREALQAEIDGHPLNVMMRELKQLDAKLNVLSASYEARRTRLVGYRNESQREIDREKAEQEKRRDAPLNYGPVFFGSNGR